MESKSIEVGVLNMTKNFALRAEDTLELRPNLVVFGVLTLWKGVNECNALVYSACETSFSFAIILTRSARESARSFSIALLR